jgi:hypothetical protein
MKSRRQQLSSAASQRCLALGMRPCSGPEAIVTQQTSSVLAGKLDWTFVTSIFGKYLSSCKVYQQDATAVKSVSCSLNALYQPRSSLLLLEHSNCHFLINYPPFYSTVTLIWPQGTKSVFNPSHQNEPTYSRGRRPWSQVRAS